MKGVGRAIGATAYILEIRSARPGGPSCRYRAFAFALWSCDNASHPRGIGDSPIGRAGIAPAKTAKRTWLSRGEAAFAGWIQRVPRLLADLFGSGQNQSATADNALDPALELL